MKAFESWIPKNAEIFKNVPPAHQNTSKYIIMKTTARPMFGVVISSDINTVTFSPQPPADLVEVRCPLFVLPEPSAHWTILGCRHLCACYWRADLAWPYLVFQRPHQQVCWKKVRRKQGGPFLGHDCPGLPPFFSEACPKRKDKCLQPSWGPSGSISMDVAKCLGVAGPYLKFALSKRKQDSWGTELCLRRRGKQKDMVSQVLGTMERYWGQKSRSWTAGLKWVLAEG